MCYSARVSKLTSRPTGLCVEQVGEESVEPGDERGVPSPSSEPTTTTSHDEAEQEKDGALGVPGRQPDVSPSGPNNHNNNISEPKV